MTPEKKSKLALWIAIFGLIFQCGVSVFCLKTMYPPEVEKPTVRSRWRNGFEGQPADPERLHQATRYYLDTPIYSKDSSMVTTGDYLQTDFYTLRITTDYMGSTGPVTFDSTFSVITYVPGGTSLRVWPRYLEGSGWILGRLIVSPKIATSGQDAIDTGYSAGGTNELLKKHFKK